MFVDIHTHNATTSEFPAIRNLTFVEAEKTFSTDEKGLFSVGFHPWFADEFIEKSLTKLQKWANDKRFVAVGECGLDKNSKAAFQVQVAVFRKQILLSEAFHKPLIIHCVGYFNELMELKKQINPMQLWIIHSFRGKPELAAQMLKADCALSFGEHYNAESVRITPLEKLFIETDESNLPIQHIYHQIAVDKNLDFKLLTAGEDFIKKIIL